MNAQFENMHLFCVSIKVCHLEMAISMVDDLKVLQYGVWCMCMVYGVWCMFDAYLNREVLVLAPVMACMCDNPRASEVVGHLRGSPNACYRQYLVSCNIVLHTQSNIQAVNILSVLIFPNTIIKPLPIP